MHNMDVFDLRIIDDRTVHYQWLRCLFTILVYSEKTEELATQSIFLGSFEIILTSFSNTCKKVSFLHRLFSLQLLLNHPCQPIYRRSPIWFCIRLAFYIRKIEFTQVFVIMYKLDNHWQRCQLSECRWTRSVKKAIQTSMSFSIIF